MAGPGCSFCSIVAGDVAAEVVHADGDTLAFLDRRPLFPGHVLLVPREHHETIEELPTALVEPLFTIARSLAGAVRRATGSEGSFVALNNTVSQSVPHLHVHIVPRNRKDGLRGFFWPRNPYVDEVHMARVAESIRHELG